MLQLSNLNVPLAAVANHGTRPGGTVEYRMDVVESAVRSRCGVPAHVPIEVAVVKRSVDARKRSDVHFVMTVTVDAGSYEQRLLAKGIRDLARSEPTPPHDIPALASPPAVRPIVVGFGAAGMFAALELARAGARPIVIEQGQSALARQDAIRSFNETGTLDVLSNIQFGEGGAGTFSDGKLSTNTRNPLIRFVLETFVEMGAPADVLVDSKPHVGTDLLPSIVTNLRLEIERLGGEVRFDTKLVDITSSNENSGGKSGQRLESVTVVSREGISERLAADTMILATGHSARDTYRMLSSHRVPMTPKAFSMGVRIEHLQADIDTARWGAAANSPALPPADYHLSVHDSKGRGVYSFCMCPGGEVVAAASETGGVVTNGMSRFSRDGDNANSALLVSVTPEDYGATTGCDPLIGLDFQRTWEEAAFEAGGRDYRAPAQLVGDFLAGVPTSEEKGRSNRVRPTYPRGVVWGSIDACLPGFITKSLREALPLLDRKLKGFSAASAVLTGIESRSSSPVSMIRDGNLESPYLGLFPCGEGAGHAGGIMSAAVDGIRAADAVCRRYSVGNTEV